jgi:hypothetical protein
MPSKGIGRNNAGHLGLKESTGGNHQATPSCARREGCYPREISRRQSEDPKREREVAHEADWD